MIFDIIFSYSEVSGWSLGECPFFWYAQF